MLRFDAIARRYLLHDARFHALVNRLRHALAEDRVNARERRDAIRLAIVFEELDREREDRERRDAWSAHSHE